MSDVRPPEWFAKSLAMWVAVVNKPLPELTIHSYWLLLHDIPRHELEPAMIAVLRQHVYQSYPMPGQVRSFIDNRIGPIEGWHLARQAMQAAGGSWASREDIERAYTTLPRRVVACIQIVGWLRLCDSSHNESLWERAWREAANITTRSDDECVERIETNFLKGIPQHG